MTEIRLARPEEAPGLLRIAQEAYAPYLPRIGYEPPPMKQDFPADIEEGSCWVIGDPPFAFIVARRKGDDWLIENVAKMPGAEGGVGRVLIEFAEEEGRRRGFKRAVLYTHQKMTENHAYYPHIGYTETARREDEGVPRVFFSKEL